MLKAKTISVPSWFGKDGLVNEYDPDKHPVNDKALYPDIFNEERRTLQKVTRVTSNLQQLAVKRMVSLVAGIPVKRVYSPQNDRQKEIAAALENVLTRTRIDSINNDRLAMLFAGCEVVSLWYAVEQPNNNYGFSSRLKLRCRNFAPMNGDELYPLFDEYGDMVAMSIGYSRKVNGNTVQYFDAYTADRHVKYSTEGGGWAEVVNERIALMKIPAIYTYRPTPIWENQSSKVYEIEWSLSRNGNYLRENSRPVFVVFADEAVPTGEAPETDGNGSGEQGAARDVLQLPSNSKAQYVTWQQAVENLKFYVEQLRSLFFTELQLPDWSYEKMSQHALSGESRKQMFIDAQLKVKDESGRLVEFFDREINVVKAFLKVMMGSGYAADIDALPVENVITPFSINDEKDAITNLMAANGGLPLMAQRESIERLGWSDDPDKTMEEIRKQEEAAAALAATATDIANFAE